jgi:hypothetical protein
MEIKQNNFKKIIFSCIIILLFFSLQGCNRKENFGYFCSDNVNLVVKPPSSHMAKLCYDEKGMINMLLLNNGDTEIHGINVYLYAENENRNISIPIYLNKRDADLLSLNVPLKTLGTINRIEITPIVIFNNETIECEFYRIKVRHVNECY